MSGSMLETPADPGLPVLRWASRTNSLAGIEAELARIWSSTPLTTSGDGGSPERRIAARTSVLNLVVIARQPEVGERAAAIIRLLAGRHPSRTLIVSSADPDGPSWIDAHVQAHCMLPRADAAETCVELIDLVAGGETGRHVAAIVAPLLVHDLPVTLWWPGDPPLTSRPALDLLDMANRLVVDGSAWSGDGIGRLLALARLVAGPNRGEGRVAISDFAMLRQSRWREAIASSFDRPELRPFVTAIGSVTVRYAAHPDAEPGDTNVIKPLYHVAWLASRLGMTVVQPLVVDADQAGAPMRGVLRAGRRPVAAALVAEASPMPPGTTLAVELGARRLGSELGVTVTAEADAVIVRTTLDGRGLPVRQFMAPRRTEVELLAESIESVGRDRIATAALITAASLVGRAAPGTPG